MKDKHIKLCIKDVNAILQRYDHETQITIVNMLTYSQYPIDGHDEVSQIVSTLISAINGTAVALSENPIIKAAGAVQEIWTIVHGQAHLLAQSEHIHIEEAVARITSEVLEELQQNLMSMSIAS